MIYEFIQQLIEIKMNDRIKVIARVRPLLSFEEEPVWAISTTNIHCLPTKSIKQTIIKSTRAKDQQQQIKSYSFDFQKVVSTTTSTQTIYKAQIQSAVNKSIANSIDCCIGAYGATCSGKTYTMLGVKQFPGIIPCIMKDILAFTKQKGCELSVKVGYVEIYNEKVRDLLNGLIELKISEKNGEADIDGLTKMRVDNFGQFLNAIEKGQKNRTYADRQNHGRSSRSHTIFRIYIQKWDEHLQYKQNVINVIDLAGSQKLTQHTNPSETGSINKSLFQFSNVLSKLSQNTSQHIPYRDSKLTRLLQHSLVSNCLFLMIFCVSPALQSFHQTKSTLRLAAKTKHIVPKELDFQSYDKDEQIKILKSKLREKEKEVVKLQLRIEELEIKGQKSASTKALVLMDHENFMVAIDKQISQISQVKAEQIKQNFLSKINQLYEDYVKDIMKNQLGDEPWLKVEEICFLNMMYEKQQMIEYRVPIIKSILSTLNEDSHQFKDLLQNYLLQLTHSINPSLEQSEIQSGRNDFPTLQSNQLFCWGCPKDYRVFKTQTKTIHGISQMSTLGTLKQIACGSHHSLVVSCEGNVYGWGKNNNKQITSTKQTYISIPRQISIKSISMVAAGWGHSLALSDSGLVYSWGYGKDGQLGNGIKNQQDNPTLISHNRPIISVHAGHSHSGFIDDNNDYYAFGFNQDYRLMMTSEKEVSSPKRVKVKNVRKAALGVSHSCLLTGDGQVFLGGVGSNGEFGIELNPSIDGYQIIQVSHKAIEEEPFEKVCPLFRLNWNGERVKDISCGECMTAIVDNKGNLYTFGKVSHHRLGHQNSETTLILKNVDQVRLGYRHGLAITKAKQVYGWGFNMYKQLGTAHQQDIASPELINSLSNERIEEIGCGFFHSAAIGSDE